MRFFVAGFQHETNSFAAGTADWDSFLRGDFFPPLTRGAEMLARHRSGGLPMAGFLRAAIGDSHDIEASCWAGASPSGPIARSAFERIADMIEEDLRQALANAPLDGIYLDLHGAAVCDDLFSPDAVLAGRIRAIAGDMTPIVASLDLHANVDAMLLAALDYATAYRTYPHVDMEECGQRAYHLLKRRIASATRENLTFCRIPFLIPIITQNTLRDPARAIYAQLDHLDASTDASPSLCMGFPATDVPQCGPALWAYGPRAAEVADGLLDAIIAVGEGWRAIALEPDEAVARALAMAQNAGGPVIIADVQDNPGAGANSNCTGLLHALLRHKTGTLFPQRIALGLLNDPDAAAQAAHAGVGESLTLSLGKSEQTWAGVPSDPPVVARCTVVSLHDGKAVLEGPMMTGARVDAGPCACLDIDGVLVVVSSAKTQMLDQVLYRMVGIEPEQMAVLVNKSAVHFHADFDSIASHVLYAKAMGPMAADPADLTWTNIDPGIALSPFSPPR